MPKSRTKPNTQTHPFGKCLYFTANAVARQINKLAEEAFAPIGLCPSGALLLRVIADNPAIASSTAAETLHLAPSSVTRFADNLVRRGLVEREQQGRRMLLHLTDEGEALLPRIQECWENLYESYSADVGKRRGQQVALELGEIAALLGD